MSEGFDICEVRGREILDSRGNPTVEAEVVLENGAVGRASVPSGASTGTHEAVELRDGKERYKGQGVRRAVQNVSDLLGEKILYERALDQRNIDRLLLEADGTENKSRAGPMRCWPFPWPPPGPPPRGLAFLFTSIWAAPRPIGCRCL